MNVGCGSLKKDGQEISEQKMERGVYRRIKGVGRPVERPAALKTLACFDHQ